MIHHIAIKTHRVRCLASFYKKVFGLTEIKNKPENDSVWLKDNKMILMIEKSETKSCKKKQNAGWHLVAFAITKKERARWKQKLKRHRVKIIGETAYSLFFSDPDGNRLALSHYPKKHLPS